MSRNVAGLTEVQERALELLLAGKTVTATAEAVGVDRRTVSRWRLEDAAFMAELNKRRLELRDAARAKLMAMVGTAIDAIHLSIAEGNAKTALALLEGLRIIGTDAERDSTETSRAAIQAELDRKELADAMAFCLAQTARKR